MSLIIVGGGMTGATLALAVWGYSLQRESKIQTVG